MMNRHYHKKSAKRTALLIAATVLVAFVFAGVRPLVSYADNISDLKKNIEQKQQEIKDAQNQKKDLQSGLTDVKSVIRELEKSKETLATYVSELDTKVSNHTDKS